MAHLSHGGTKITRETNSGRTGLSTKPVAGRSRFAITRFAIELRHFDADECAADAQSTAAHSKEGGVGRTLQRAKRWGRLQRFGPGVNQAAGVRRRGDALP